MSVTTVPLVTGVFDPSQAATLAAQYATLGVGGSVSGGTILGVNVTESIASGASATWDGVLISPLAATVTGGTNITTAAGFNALKIAAPTINDATAVTITNAATVTILGAPVGGGAGPVTITNAYAFWVQAGAVRFDGQIRAADGTVGAPSYSFASSGNTDNGLYLTGGDAPGMVAAGAIAASWSASGAFVWNRPLILVDSNGSNAAKIDRDAIAVVSFKNSTEQQTVRIYGTTSSSRYLQLTHDTTHGIITHTGTGQLSYGSAALATNATTGFLTVQSCNGTPTGAPTSLTGQIPMVYDTSANKIWFYNGSWRGVSVT